MTFQAEEKSINWDQDALSIHNKIRALYPWPVSEVKMNGTVLKLIKTRPGVALGSEEAKAPNGSVLSVDRKAGFFAVKTGSGVLLVEKVQPSGKKEMTVPEFLNGHEINKGMRLE